MQREICNEFNNFFTNIGPKLADKINTENKKCFENYLKNRILTSFAFDLVDESIVIKHISTLRTKNPTAMTASLWSYLNSFYQLW